MPPLKDDVLRKIARHKGSVTEQELAEAQLGDVVDLAVSQAAVAFVRITNQGQVVQSPTNIMFGVGGRNGRLRMMVANVEAISHTTGVESLMKRLEDTLDSPTFVAAGVKNTPCAKVEPTNERLLTDEERDKVITAKMNAMSAMDNQGTMLASGAGLYYNNLPMQTQGSIGSSSGIYQVNDWSNALHMMMPAPGCFNSQVPMGFMPQLTPVSAQLASFGHMPSQDYSQFYKF